MKEHYEKVKGSHLWDMVESYNFHEHDYSYQNIAWISIL